MPLNFTGGYHEEPKETRPLGKKLSVSEFNTNKEVKELSGIVHRYLNKEAIPGSGFFGIKERPDEYLGNPA